MRLRPSPPSVLARQSRAFPFFLYPRWPLTPSLRTMVVWEVVSAVTRGAASAEKQTGGQCVSERSLPDGEHALYWDTLVAGDEGRASSSTAAEGAGPAVERACRSTGRAAR